VHERRAAGLGDHAVDVRRVAAVEEDVGRPARDEEARDVERDRAGGLPDEVVPEVGLLAVARRVQDVRSPSAPFVEDGQRPRRR
jgi:hypothetical protein